MSDSTYRMTSNRFEFAPVGELTLKGKQEAVRAWQLIGRRSTAATRRASRLVGRDRELSAAARVLEPGTTVAVSGEAGVGKSRLTDELRLRAAVEGVRWLQTRCLSYGAALAYWPFAELLRTTGSFSADPFFARLLGTANGDDDLEPEAFRRGLHDAFASWLADLARERPTVICVEDFHWADPSSLELTRGAGTVRSTELRCSLYMTARPEARVELDVLAPEWQVRPRRLGLEDVATLVEDLLAVRHRRSSSCACAPARPATPSSSARSCRPCRSATFWPMRTASGGCGRVGTRTLPDSIEGALAARLDALPWAATSLLQTASVIGRRVGVSLLREVHDTRDIEVEPRGARGPRFRRRG